MSRWLLLCEGLALGRAVTFPDGVVRYVRSVEREDGSGRSFNVRARRTAGGTDETVYVRTVDD